MGEVGKFIFGNNSSGSRNSIQRLVITARDGYTARSASQRLILSPQLRTVGEFNSG